MTTFNLVDFSKYNEISIIKKNRNIKINILNKSIINSVHEISEILVSQSNLNKINDNFSYYTFSLLPNAYQPSGTINFSKINNFKSKIYKY